MARREFTYPEVCHAPLRAAPRGAETRHERRARTFAARTGSVEIHARPAAPPRDGNPPTVGTGHGFREAGGSVVQKREGGRSRLWTVKKGRGRGGVYGTGPVGDLGQRSYVLNGAAANRAAGDNRARSLSGLVVGGKNRCGKNR